MGNALRFLCGSCQRPTAADDPQSLGPHGVTSENVGVSALAQDLLFFDITSRVPANLSQHVNSSQKAQASWYNKLFKAWNEARPPPKSPEAAAKLVVQTLHNLQIENLKGFLAFYRLPFVPHTTEETLDVTPAWPEGVKFELQTLPVDGKCIGDGDSFTVYVNTAEPRELFLMPQEVKDAITARANARAAKNFALAKLIQQNVIAAGYRFLGLANHQEILAHKYRIRLRGVDAPEGRMPYGEAAKQELLNMLQGKCLEIHVYGEDQYGRSVGDVYCHGVFIQEQLLKRGCAWHYVVYDSRPEFATWEKEARFARRGLWALPNPEKPWVWRRNNKSRKREN